MDTVLIVDIDPRSADLICTLLNENQIPARCCQDFEEIRESIEEGVRPAVIFAHCALVNYSFAELAILNLHPDVKLLFYCTDADHKSAETIVKLPEELAEVILRITESKKLQTKVG